MSCGYSESDYVFASNGRAAGELFELRLSMPIKTRLAVTKSDAIATSALSNQRRCRAKVKCSSSRHSSRSPYRIVRQGACAWVDAGSTVDSMAPGRRC
jgi:hypothetical protein